MGHGRVTAAEAAQGCVLVARQQEATPHDREALAAAQRVHRDAWAAATAWMLAWLLR